MVKVWLHSTGDASPLHANAAAALGTPALYPNAAAALGTPALAALFLTQILPVLCSDASWLTFLRVRVPPAELSQLPP